RLYHSEKLRGYILNTLGFAYFTLASVFILYPPFLISLGLGSAALVLGYIANHRNLLKKAKLKKLIGSLLLWVGINSTVGAAYLTEFRDLLSVIANTSYPGQRHISSGGYSLIQVFFGFYNFLLKHDTATIPKVLNNQSEAAGFFLLSLFAIPVDLLSKFVSKIKHLDYISLSMLVYLGITLSWALIDLPEFIGKITFLTLVPQNRMMIGVYAFSLIYIFYFLSKKTVFHKRELLLNGAACLSVLVIHVTLGLHMLKTYPDFFTSPMALAVGTSAATLSAIFLFYKKRTLFIISILIFSFYTTWRVNPLYLGLDPLTNSALTQELGNIQKDNRENKRWAVFDTIVFGNYLAANGIRVLNGVHLYPQLDLWEKLDPQRAYLPYYNRYAHVVFLPDKGDEVEFDTPQGDILNVSINPCHHFFKELQVGFILSTKEINNSCLQEIKDIKYSGTHLFFYKMIDNLV
ncbi:MAG: hypothetical protein NG784_15890, partial [Candidatus Jettenia sp.]|nr:hypothetical protein [Candidatus Jettenia sp.]